VNLSFNKANFWSFVVDLWSQVVLQDSQAVDLILYHKWLIFVEAKACEGGEWRSFVEHVEIADSELLGHAVGHFQGRVIVFGVIGSDLDRATSNFTFNCELHKFWACCDRQGLVQRVKLFADLCKLGRVD